MKTTTLKKLAIAICGLAISGSAFAIPITGDIRFGGDAALDGPMATANAVTEFSFIGMSDTQIVLGVTDTFDIFVNNGDLASFSAWTFDPSTAVSPLWSVGGFNFNLGFSTIVMQTANFLNIVGTGVVTHAGYDDTAFVWSFTATNADGRLHTQYSAASSAVPASSVPDGGATVALLGAALLLMVAVRSRKTKFAR